MQRMVPLAWVLMCLSLSACAGSGGLGPQTPPPGLNAGPLAEIDQLEPSKPIPQCDEKAPAARPGKASLLVQDVMPSRAQIIRLSGNGRVLAAVTPDGVLRVWDTRAGVLLGRRIVGLTAQAVALDHAGHTLVYFGQNATTGSFELFVIDLERSFRHRSIGTGAAGFDLSPDGKRLVVGKKNLELFDTATGRHTGTIPIAPLKGYLARVVFDRTGKRLAVATMTGDLGIVDVSSKKMTPVTNPSPAAKTMPPMAIDFAGDDLLIRASDGVYRASSKQSVPPVRYSGPVNHAVALDDMVLSADPRNGDMLAWDLVTGAKRAVPIRDKRKVSGLATSRDGSTLVVVHNHWGQKERHSTVVYDTATSSPIRSIRGASVGTWALGVAPDGQTLWVGSVSGDVYHWNLARGEMQRVTRAEERQEAKGLEFLPDGKHVIYQVGSYFVRIREASTGRVVRQWDAGHGHLAIAALLPDAERMVTSGRDGTVRLWWLGKRQPAAPERPAMRFAPLGAPQMKEVGKIDTKVHGAALSKDGKLIALDGANGRVALLELATGKVRWQVPVPTKQVGKRFVFRWLTFGPGDKTVLVSGVDTQQRGTEKNKLYELDVAKGMVSKARATRSVGPMALFGNKLLMGGKHPGVLSVPGYKQLTAIPAASDMVLSVAVGPKGKRLFLGDDSGATTIAAADTGKPQFILVATQDGEYVAATPEGMYGASLEGARRIGWRYQEPLEAFSFEQFAAKYDRPKLLRRLLAGESAETPTLPSRPPRIALAGAVARKVKDATVAVSAKVRSSQRVDRVRAYVNGRPAADELVCKPSGKVDLEVPLQGGRNRVHLVAYDGAGYASHPLVLDVTSESEEAKRPTLWIVAVGVSRYPNLAPAHQLDVADDDARAITKAFSEQVGPGRPFKKVNAVTLVDEQVTVGSIEHAVLGLTKMAPDDVAVVFFAGHGVKLADGAMVFLTHQASLSEKEAKAHGVGWSRIQRVLSHVKGRVIMLLDACHSGHMTTELIALNDALAGELAARDRAGTLVFAAARGAQLSYEVGGGGSSSRGLELAWEGKKPQLAEPISSGHGLFTAAVLEALAGRAPDRDRGGGIELGEFVDYVTERVRAASNGQQTPWVARREIFGDFVVAPAAK